MKNKNIFFFSPFLFFMWANLFAQSPQEIFKQANEAYENSNYALAINKVIFCNNQLGKINPRTQSLLVLCYYEQGDYTNAKIELNKYKQLVSDVYSNTEAHKELMEIDQKLDAWFAEQDKKYKSKIDEQRIQQANSIVLQREGEQKNKLSNLKNVLEANLKQKIKGEYGDADKIIASVYEMSEGKKENADYILLKDMFPKSIINNDLLAFKKAIAINKTLNPPIDFMDMPSVKRISGISLLTSIFCNSNNSFYEYAVEEKVITPAYIDKHHSAINKEIITFSKLNTDVQFFATYLYSLNRVEKYEAPFYVVLDVYSTKDDNKFKAILPYVKDINDEIDNKNNTWLFRVLNDGREELVQPLIERGSNVNAKHSISRLYPLHLAIDKSLEKSVVALINAGANVNAPDVNGFEPLHLAIYKGLEKSVTALINANANVNAKDGNGLYPLHLAIYKGLEKSVIALINANANVNAYSNEDFTPLHFAAREGNTFVAEKLLEKGANRKARSAYHQKPWQVARDHGYKSLAKKLKHK